MSKHNKPDCNYCNERIKQIRQLGEDNLWNPFLNFLRSEYAPNHSPIQNSQSYISNLSHVMGLKHLLLRYYSGEKRLKPQILKVYQKLISAGWVSDSEKLPLALQRVDVVYNPLEEIIDSQLPIKTRERREFLKVNGAILFPACPKNPPPLILGHSESYISEIERRAKRNEQFDEETPLNQEIILAAKSGVNTAIQAAKRLDTSRIVIALNGTPGHHAAYERNWGGLCYYNNAAIVANFLSKNGLRVAILDIDSHYANGTADITEKLGKWTLFDLHETVWASPFSEGDSTGGTSTISCRNYSVNIGANGQIYGHKLKKAIKDIEQAKPQVLVVSLGVDGYVKDPFGLISLDSRTFSDIGASIGDLLRKTRSKGIFLTEGGYGEESSYLFALVVSEANKRIYKT